MPIAVRVHASLAVDDRALEEKLASYRRLGIPLWVTVRMPASVQDAERWRQELTGLLERYGDSIAILEIAIDREQPQLGAFAAKLAATEARAARPAIRIAIGGTLAEDPEALTAVYTQELAPYVDLLVVSDGAAQAARDALATFDPDAALALAGMSDGVSSTYDATALG